MKLNSLDIKNKLIKNMFSENKYERKVSNVIKFENINLNNEPKNIFNRTIINYKGSISNDTIELLSKEEIESILKKEQIDTDNFMKTDYKDDKNTELKIINARYKFYNLYKKSTENNAYRNRIEYSDYDTIKNDVQAELVLKLFSDKYKTILENEDVQDKLADIIETSYTKEQNESRFRFVDESMSEQYKKSFNKEPIKNIYGTLLNISKDKNIKNKVIDLVEKLASDANKKLFANTTIQSNLANFIQENIYYYDNNTTTETLKLISKGIDIYTARKMTENIHSEHYKRLHQALESGERPDKAEYIASHTYIYKEWLNLPIIRNNPIHELFTNKEANKSLQKATKGKYQDQFILILESYPIRRNLLNCGLSQEDFLESVKKISTSTYKLAMDTPNQYLSNIDIIYTKKDKNGKYPRLDKINISEFKKEQKSIENFFQTYLPVIIKIGNYLDTDTINQMMDRRTSIFKNTLSDLNYLKTENLELIKKLIKGKSVNTKKPLTAKDKVQLCQIMISIQDGNIDKKDLEEMAQSGEIDIPRIKEKMKLELLKMVEVNEKEISKIDKEKLNFNEEFSHLLFAVYDKDLYNVIREAILGDFKNYITKDDNIYSETNRKTKKLFLENGLNYKKWLKPDIEDVEFEANNKKLKIKLWDRNPQEDLFIGNKTTCCTGIATGKNWRATPLYLLNTAFNVAELYDENNNVVGMSRVFMAKINKKPTLIMDNIELNNTFIKSFDTAERKKIRDNFFKYMNQYAKEIMNDENAQVLISSVDHVDRYTVDDLYAKAGNFEFIGEISNREIYINSMDTSWVNPHNIFDDKVCFYIVPNDK